MKEIRDNACLFRNFYLILQALQQLNAVPDSNINPKGMGEKNDKIYCSRERNP